MNRSKALTLLATLALLLGLLPLILSLSAAVAAQGFGCTLNEAGASACIVMGRNIKDILYSMAMAFWLFLFTWLYIPVAIALAVAAFRTRQSEKGLDQEIKRVGLRFWLISIALMVLPLYSILSVLLLVLAALHWAVIRFSDNRAKVGSKGA